jgi:hypothetical protein
MVQQKLGVAQHAGAIIRDPMKQKHPIPTRRWCPDFPAPEFDAIRRANRKILFRSPSG